MAESTIWTQLSSPNSPVGSIPYVTSDGVTIGTDVLNLSYNDGTVTTPTGSSVRAKQLTVEGGFRICFDDLTAVATPTSVTINKPAGKLLLPAGQTTIRVFNTFVQAGSIVLLQLETNDATAVNIGVVVQTGQFVCVANAAATGNTRISFVVVATF